MSVYQWSTGPGTRIEPDAGEKVSGFVPTTPAAAKKLNDILYELTTFAIDFETKFGVQHDVSTGEHTDITGETIEISKVGTQWLAFGLDGFAVKLIGDFPDITSYPFRTNQAGYFTCYATQSQESYSLSYGYGDANTAVYKEFTRNILITQDSPLGSGAVTETSAGINVVKQIELANPGAGTCLIPFDRPLGSRIKKIGIWYIPVGDTYSFGIRVYQLSPTNLTWSWDGDIDGAFTGGVGEGGVAQYKELILADDGILTGSSDILAGLSFSLSDGAIAIRAIKIVFRSHDVETML